MNLPSTDSRCLPWTLLIEQSIEERPELFTEESFVCVCTETSLDSDSPDEFARYATDFVNDRVNGSLCASITFPPTFASEYPGVRERCLFELRYGSVCINQWSGLAYALTTLPWGAYPGASLANVDSGIGNVHNTYLLDAYQKAVLEGPLISFPKSVWFPSHRNALRVARALLELYVSPTAMRIPRLLAYALTG